MKKVYILAALLMATTSAHAGNADSVDIQGKRIEIAMAAVAVLMLVLAGLAAVLVTRRTVGRIEEINATSRAIMQSGLDQRIPLRGLSLIHI